MSSRATAQRKPPWMVPSYPSLWQFRPQPCFSAFGICCDARLERIEAYRSQQLTKTAANHAWATAHALQATRKIHQVVGLCPRRKYPDWSLPASPNVHALGISVANVNIGNA